MQSQYSKYTTAAIRQLLQPIKKHPPTVPANGAKSVVTTIASSFAVGMIAHQGLAL
jgi:hypothetical protein